ncbi:uncharacterized protein LOC126758166 isoform X2 [Bactrocera neohumeralis]|uniref:uncharacterized protein LOC120775009 isoform X2 n=1 Tax=Bactrocera tryoni TaxID=59916 RepID=UPI001A9A18A1|nr:uncharacterized protein LOC120775009 isoform X2 [Bactrocera tryoni]XP_050328230.1 uncharacterized protein LOC126758166 isoform X2 [Bactrocera neohumeralis]
MTFYWWSHWFWITTLSTILLSITLVHTYPSQEISLEYNQDSKSVKAVTKLHQTTTSLEWSTTTPAVLVTTSNKNTESDAVVAPIIQQQLNDNAGSTDEELVSEDVDTKQVEAAFSEIEDTSEHEKENIVENDDRPTAEEGEYKRSAESYNKTIEEPKGLADEESLEEPQVAAVVAEQRSVAIEESRQKLNRADEELSNYTNSSRKRDGIRGNATCVNCKAAAHEPSSTAEATRTLEAPKALTNNSTTTAVNANSRIDSMHSDTLEWLNAMAVAAALPVPKLLTNAPQATEIDREVVTVPTESATVDAAAAAATTQQRIPFTLENANKEDELRRAENEHRSRKSKVLSAEYKHINRYINYSSDSKSLLTRSAATTPNDFGGVEEGNISSEALSIQRTYFLDAGAISAICFTIFGVCCTVGTIGIVLYRRRYVNKPQALSEPDSSVYIDDSTMRVSDNSDEMYSLDNDSFLNSLEAMTIQNYWTDTVKHTKL